MKTFSLLLLAAVLTMGCNRNRVDGEKGYVEPEAKNLSTIKTGTTTNDASTAGAGSATGPGGETSGGSFATGGNAIPGSQGTNLLQPPPTPEKK